jgi:prolyl oligopeptidase
MRGILILLAVVILAGLGYFFLWPQGGGQAPQATQATDASTDTPSEEDAVTAAMADDTMTDETAMADEMADEAALTDAEDPYLWLEEVEGEEALAWVRAQNEETLTDLKSDPRYQNLYEASLEVYTSQDRIIAGEPRDGFLYDFWQDETHVRGIWRRAPLADYLAGEAEWDVILDLDALASDEDENWVWDGADCLHGSTRCLIAMSHGGSDANFVREFDMETRAFVEDGFYLDEAKQGTNWVDENTVLVATDRGEGSMTTSGYPNTVAIWQRGTAPEDARVIFEGELDDVGTFPSSYTTPEEHYNVIVRAVTFFEFEHYLVGEGGELMPLPVPTKADLQGFHGGQVVFSLNDDWTVATADGDVTHPSGSVISYAVDDLGGDEPHFAVNTLFVPEDRVAFQAAAASGGALYLTMLDNVVGRAQRATFDGEAWALADVTLPDNGTVAIAATDDMADRVFFNYESFLIPDSLYYSEDGSTPAQTQSLPEWFDAEGLVAEQHVAVSADGERIPYFLIRSADIPFDGSTPTILYGYGGFQISMNPFYSGNVGRLWLARGGAYALANIRGGGEFGPTWHQAALRENRQRAFDDFIAIGEHLIETGVTSPEHLGIQGGSNGGLLVGAVMVQRPDLLNAVVCQVPLLDMLRFNQLLAGASWMGEYGNPDVAEDRAFIAEYSPYQNVNPDADYPNAFFYTSTRDDRVHPGHARKMVARMMEQGHSVQYFERIEGGHSAGANLEQSAERVALEYVYLTRQLMD